MAVMSSQPPIAAHEQKPLSAAPSPTPATVGSTVSDEAMGMDLDLHGTKQVENTSSRVPEFDPSSPKEYGTNSASSFVNGHSAVKEFTAPPSPPIPTPPLHHSNDNAQDLSDLHITSPDGTTLPAGNFKVNGGFGLDGSDDDMPMDGSEGSSDQRGGSQNRNEGHQSQKEPNGSTEVKSEKRDGQSNVTDSNGVVKESVSGKSSRDREDEEEEERPLKRAKTEDTADDNTFNTSPSAQGSWTGPLTSARAKHVLGIVRSLRRTRDARPFSMPVDAVKLNVPHYYEVIKNPMDLQTMERKLNSNEYSTVDEFVDDFKLIMSNCVIFNGPEHPVTTMSKSMEASFDRQMKDLPAEDAVDLEKPKPSKKKGGGSSSKKKATQSAQPTPPVQPKREPKQSAQSPPAISPTTFGILPSGIPQIRRESAASDGRPKREIHPPAPKDLPYSTKPRRKHAVNELKFCETVIKELHKKVHQDYAFPFYVPVDPVALNIPDYFKIIKKPMDLSTIQEKLKLNQYENANEFEADIRLMFNNCYKFNPENQAVHQFGRRLESVFDNKWKEKPVPTQSSRSPSPPPPNEELSEDEVEDDGDSNIAELEKKLERMKNEIAAIKGRKKTPPTTSTKKKSGAVRKNSTAVPGKKSKKASAPYITLEQKTELSERINYLSPAKMHYALKMIKETCPELDDGGEIELDIDELDPNTLHKLYSYVSKHAPEVQTPYVPPPPPPQPTHEAKPRSKSAPKGKKNKPMSAAEQEAKIKDLQSRLHHFDNPGAAPSSVPPAVDSDSSDDEESSGSESEEE